VFVKPELISYGGSVIKRPLIVLIYGSTRVDYGRSCCFVFTPQVVNCLTSSCYPLRLGLPVLLKPTPLQLRVKEQDRAEVALYT
jgi:hypothetical protein